MLIKRERKCISTKEWRGHSYALYPRGAPGKWNPFLRYQECSTPKACAKLIIEGRKCLFLAFPFAL